MITHELHITGIILIIISLTIFTVRLVSTFYNVHKLNKDLRTKEYSRVETLRFSVRLKKLEEDFRTTLLYNVLGIVFCLITLLICL